MRNLITFLLKNTSWFFFIFLEVICFYFIFQDNAYQRSVYLNSSSELVGRVYLVSGNVRSFFGLKKNNEELLSKNAELQLEVWRLRKMVDELHTSSLPVDVFLRDSLPKSNYDFIVSKVINATINQVDNYIEIDKGSNDGVELGDGVISQQGVVGKVMAVSSNYAIVMSLLNSKSKLDCKIKGTNVSGTLLWDGKDYRYANLETPSGNETLIKGDTILVRYSHAYPEGVEVGCLDELNKHQADNSYTLKVKLFTNYSMLSDVLVIKDEQRSEKVGLEKEVSNVK